MACRPQQPRGTTARGVTRLTGHRRARRTSMRLSDEVTSSLNFASSPRVGMLSEMMESTRLSPIVCAAKQRKSHQKRCGS